MSTPTWSAVDHNTGDLLDLIAEQNPATPTEVDEWQHFLKVLAKVATATGQIDQNAVRPLLAGEIKPQRIGAMYRRAVKEGRIVPAGWTTTDHSESGNTGRPCRAYRRIGA